VSAALGFVVAAWRARRDLADPHGEVGGYVVAVAPADSFAAEVAGLDEV